MKRPVAFILCIGLSLLLGGCISIFQAKDPSGYEVDTSSIKFPQEKDIIIRDDKVFSGWWQRVTLAEYQPIADIIAQANWEIRDDSQNNIADVPIFITISSEGKNPQETEPSSYYIFENEVIWGDKGSCDMPAGSFVKIHSYIQELYNKHKNEITQDPAAWLSHYLSDSYYLEWDKDFDEPEYKRDKEWVLVEYFKCYSDNSLTADLKKAFNNLEGWQEAPITEYVQNINDHDDYININSYHEDGKEKIFNDYNHVHIFRLTDETSLVAVNFYAAYITPYNLYEEVLNILDNHQDKWKVNPMIE